MRVVLCEDTIGLLLLTAGPSGGPRVQLAMDELAVFRQEMKARAGQQLEGDVLARLQAMAEAAERLLGPDGGVKP